MRHGQHPRLPPSNYDRGCKDKDIPVIPASDLTKASNHFLAMVVLLLAFLSSLSSLSRAAAIAAGQCSDRGFVAVSIANDDNGVKQKCQGQQCHDSDSSNGKAVITVSSLAGCKRRYCHNLDSYDDNDACSSGGANCGGDNKGVKDCWRDNRGTGITTQCHVTTNKQRA